MKFPMQFLNYSKSVAKTPDHKSANDFRINWFKKMTEPKAVTIKEEAPAAPTNVAPIDEDKL